jgi:hypothetical protein
VIHAQRIQAGSPRLTDMRCKPERGACTWNVGLHIPSQGPQGTANCVERFAAGDTGR